jgi:hypothetical protein
MAKVIRPYHRPLILKIMENNMNDVKIIRKYNEMLNEALEAGLEIGLKNNCICVQETKSLDFREFDSVESAMGYVLGYLDGMN